MDKKTKTSPIHLEIVKVLLKNHALSYLLAEYVSKEICLYLSDRHSLVDMVRFEILRALEQRFPRDEYLTTAQVAKILNCHPKTLLKTADRLGLQKFYLNPRKCRFLRSEVEQLKENL